MIPDLIRAILGPKHCDWCTGCGRDGSDTRWETFWYDETHPRRALIATSLMLFWTDMFPVWRLGHAIHLEFHRDDTVEDV